MRAEVARTGIDGNVKIYYLDSYQKGYSLALLAYVKVRAAMCASRLEIGLWDDTKGAHLRFPHGGCKQ